MNLLGCIFIQAASSQQAPTESLRLIQILDPKYLRQYHQWLLIVVQKYQTARVEFFCQNLKLNVTLERDALASDN